MALGVKDPAVFLEALRKGLENALTDMVYDCTRVWEAWSYGTMTQDDFVPVTERLDDILLEVLEQFVSIQKEG